MGEHGRLVSGVARSYAQDSAEAEDLYQEVWLTVWRERRAFRGEAPFRHWLYQVAANVCRSHVRSAQVRRRAYEIMVTQSVLLMRAAIDPLSRAAWRQEIDMIRRALVVLPERQREVLVLTRLEGMTHKEVAVLLGLKQASVRSHLRHALRTLRVALEESNGGLSRRRSSDRGHGR